MAAPTKELFDIMTAEMLYYAHILYKVDYMEKYNITKTAYEENCDTFIEQWKDTNLKDNSKIEIFIELIRPKSKILDIGAGFGKDVSYFTAGVLTALVLISVTILLKNLKFYMIT